VSSFDVAGVYLRTGSGVRDTLVLNTNGHFQQYVTYTNGGKWAVTGMWTFKYEVVDLDRCYAAFDFEHKTIIIPPELLAMQTLWVEKNKLMKNQYEPMWIRQIGTSAITNSIVNTKEL
jgi:hypothetical protein